MASSAEPVGSIVLPFAANVVTDALTGLASVTFPSGLFTAAPKVAASASNTSGDGRDIIVTLVGAPTAAGCTVQARKSRTLLASILSLAALQGFDTFAPVSTTVSVIVAR